MTATPTLKSASAAMRNIANYLQLLRSVVDRATASRQSWIRQIGSVTLAIRSGDSQAAAQAGVIGAEQTTAFQAFRDELTVLAPPPSCENCHLAVVGWIEKQIAACETMVDIGRTGNVELMRQATGLLAEGRIDTMRFRAEYELLVSVLQQNLKARKPIRKLPRVSWPFGKKSRAGALS